MGKRAHNLRGSFPLGSTDGDCFDWTCTFETNDTGTPDGFTADGTNAISDGITLARSDVGVYTITFPAGRRPLYLLHCSADFREDLADYSVKCTGYSAGVLTLKAYLDDGSPAVADTNDKTIQVRCKFSRK